MSPATVSTLNVHRMTRHDLELALDWAAGEGWNPGLFDAEPFFAADPEGFFLAESDGEPVGCFSAVAYDDHFGFAGLYVVRPEFRGHRYGVVLGRAGLEYLGARTIGLDGLLARQEAYRRLGYREAYRTMRYEGTSCVESRRLVETPTLLVNLKAFPLHDLTTYDATIFPASRPAFLEAWIRQPGTHALGILRTGRLAGYGVVRPCRIGYKIGPLFADDFSLAEVLFEGLLATLPGSLVYLDVPQCNAAGVALAQRYGMKPVFETVRMYHGTPPDTDLDKEFGVTSLELG